MFKKWRLKDVILLAFLSIFFGGVFVGSGYLYNILTIGFCQRNIIWSLVYGCTYYGYFHPKNR